MSAAPRFVTKHFINGQFVDSVSGKTFEVYNPADGTVIAKVAEGDKRDIDVAVAAARAVFEKTWKYTDGVKRRDCMLRLADLVERNLTELATLETLNNGKPLSESTSVDVPMVVKCFRYYAGWADKTCGKLIPVEGNLMAMSKNEPVGVVGQIIPWNFPLLMAAWKLAPAMAMGCCVVLKPAEQTPLSVLRLAELIVEAGFPAGVINIVCGFGPECGGPLVDHPQVDKIAFTGSTEVGKIIMAAAAKTLKRVTLELGGKSPLVIAADADLDKAVGAALAGVWFNQAQVCTASSRIFVHESIHDAFVAKVVEKTKLKHQGSGLDPKNCIGPQVSKVQQDTVWGFVEAGKAAGATVALGGEKVAGPGYFIQPTIFTGVRDDMKIAREEIFGPVMSILKFSTLDEAIDRANDSCYGLAAGIISPNINTCMKFANRVKAGTVWCQTYHQFCHETPFGGFKSSGIGRELGEAGLAAYTELKTIMIALDDTPVK